MSAHQSTLEITLRAIELLKEADLTVVPRTATPHMVRAGVDHGNTDPYTVRQIYKAMVQAALDHCLDFKE